MNALEQLFVEEIFHCHKCKNDPNAYLMNPYADKNKKDDREDHMYLNRRQYLLDYIKEKEDIQIMIIGEAPGLNGCGYSGIPFTAEYNAIHHLKLSN